jgi:hypothetical protein
MTDGQLFLSIIGCVAIFLMWVIPTTEDYDKEFVHRRWWKEGDLAVWQWIYLVFCIPPALIAEIIAPIIRLLCHILAWKPSRKRTRIR